MKKKIILITLICSLFIISSLIGILFIKDTKATSDLEYIFENDVLYSGKGIFPNSTFNIRNRTLITQDNYTATYDFLDESIGSVYPNIDFLDSVSIPSGSNISIISDLEGHNHVLEYYQANTVDYLSSRHILDVSQPNGTYEFWIYLTIDRFIYFTMSEGEGVQGVYFGTTTPLKFAYNDGGWQPICDYVVNTWYHIRIDFECGPSGYKGLAPDTFFVYINGVKYGAYPFRYSIDNMEKIDIGMYKCVESNEYNTYIDAIGLNWKDYTIGQNIRDFNITETDIQEIDVFELEHYINGSILPIDYDNPNTWYDIEVGANDYVNLVASNPNRRAVNIWHQVVGNMGLERDFTIEKGIINISLSIWYFIMLNDDGYFDCSIYSFDDTLIVKLRFLFDGVDIKLYYYDGSSNILLHTFTAGQLQDISNWKNFNLYIGSSCLLTYEYTTTYKLFIFPKIDFTKEGLSKIKLIGNMPDTSHTQFERIESIGVYINGTSLAEGFGFMECNMTNEIYTDWKLKHHNLLTINANGTFRFDFYGSVGGGINITELTFFNNTDVLFNLYEGSNIIGDETFMFILFNESFTINSLRIEGVKLIENSNEYWLEFTYNGIDIDKSYFNVSNHNLYFIHYANENDTLEYIQAKFNIDDIPAINRSINFRTYFYGISKAYLVNEYTSKTTTNFEFPLGYNTINSILPQQKIISNFTITITDQNNNDYYGKSEGYITSIKLIYYTDIELTLLTLNLIGMMIVIILLFVPTIGIYTIYGKKAIIPMLILMTIICFISNLIPTWLFFILMFCYSGTIFLQYKQKRGMI